MKFFLAGILCLVILSNDVEGLRKRNKNKLKEKPTEKPSIAQLNYNAFFGSMFSDMGVISAIKSGNVQQLQVQFGNHNNRTNYLLHKYFPFAVEYADERIVDLFIRYGADIDQMYKGVPMIHLAALNPNEKVLETLIEYHVDVNATSTHGYTALHFAAINPNKQLTDLLIEMELNVNQTDNDNTTALHIAALNINPLVAHLLIKAGANVNATNNFGWTPAFFAIWNGKSAIVHPEFWQGDYGQKKIGEYAAKHNVLEGSDEKMILLFLSNHIDINKAHLLTDCPPLSAHSGLFFNATLFDAAKLMGDKVLKQFLIRQGAHGDDEMI